MPGGIADAFLRSPINPRDSKVTQVDQGVDIVSASPFLAAAGGTVVYIDPNFYNGTPAVYLKLDYPIRVNGRTYQALYYSETQSLVRVGQHVSAGTPLTAPGTAELGFAARFGSAWLPAAHGQYVEGHPTQAGDDFLGALQRSVATGPGEHTPGVTTTITSTKTGETATTSGPGAGLFSFLADITSGAFWLRVLEIVGGFLILLIGLYLLARAAGMGGDLPEPVGAGAGRELSDTAAAELQFSPGRAAYKGPRRRAPTRHEASEAGQRRAELKRRSQLAQPSDEIPF